MQDFTDHSVSTWCIFLTQNQIINQVNIFIGAALRGLLLPVSLLTVLVSLTFQRPVNATFCAPFAWKFIF